MNNNGCTPSLKEEMAVIVMVKQKYGNSFHSKLEDQKVYDVAKVSDVIMRK